MTGREGLRYVRAMPTVFDRRRENLRRLIEQWGGVGSLATKLGYANARYLVQMAGPNPTRPITEKNARKFEVTLGLEPGWLDRNVENTRKQKGQSDVDVEQVTVVVHLCGALCEELPVRLAPTKFAEVVALVYQDALRRGEVDSDLARRVIQLAK